MIDPRWVRDVALALHLFLITWMAIPAPGRGLPPGAWKDPVVRAEAAAWAERLSSLGVAWTVDDVLATASHWGRNADAVRNAVLVPAEPYFRWCGTWQSWRMFVAPQREPMRMRVDVHGARGWRTVYQEGGPESWNGRALRHERFRATVFALGWPGREDLRLRFADALSHAARQDFPEADGLRLRLQRQRTLRPEMVREGRPVERLGDPLDTVVRW